MCTLLTSLSDGNLDVQPNGLLLFGYGDGGGGPTETHIHNLRRARAAHNNGYTDIPKVKLAHNIQEFYDEILRVTDGGQRLPTWQGDLYLEFHRGVYTSHGSIKRWNRKLEIKLHNVEWAATLASLANPAYQYPKKVLDELWEGLLFNQFHDILPGSSIRMVYEDAENEYAAIDKKADKLLTAAQQMLLTPPALGISPGLENLSLNAPSTAIVALNTLAVPRHELVAVPMSQSPEIMAALQNGGAQAISTPRGQMALVPMQDVDGTGVASFSLSHAQQVAMQTQHNDVQAFYDAQTESYVLSNRLVKVVVKDGRIASLYDQVLQRELLRGGQSAGLSIAEDYPPQYDAWETELYALDTQEPIAFDSVTVHTEQGPLRASLLAKASFGKSKVSLKMSLDSEAIQTATKARTPLVLDFNVDWQEKHRFLRFEVPTNLVADSAGYETQFGITHRPTGRNTSWDAAKFEVCAHRFVDLSEAGYGVALLSESKYGFSVEGGTMRASLLKAGTYPDAHQDEGKHAFSLAVLPHTGSAEDPASGVVHAARAFNNPLAPLQGHSHGTPRGLGLYLESDMGTVVLDTIKRGEADFAYHEAPASGKTTVVARLYEAVGGHTRTRLHVRGAHLRRASTASILEDIDAELPPHQGGYELHFRPYEVKTVVLELA